MTLGEYNRKRSFEATPEPEGRPGETSRVLRFVVQKHDASHLHYDFRLELDGTLKSWAIPKGPSLNPKDRRLAVQVEDHPLSYADFEGVIPAGQYGAGEVIVWDRGAYASAETADPQESVRKIRKGFEAGDLKIVLLGEKLKGAFALVRTKNPKNWLLIKKQDEYATGEDVTAQTTSVASGKNLTRDSQGDPMPRNIKPMLAKPADSPFDREGWLFEPKWDGYRAVAEVGRDRVRLYSRNGISFAEKYPLITRALARLGHDAVLDGEIVALKGGRPDFHALQQYDAAPSPLLYAVFDLLYLDGRDLRDFPLSERKKLLETAIPAGDPLIVYSAHIEAAGRDFFKAVQDQGIEGMVAKDGSSTYEEGTRSSAWIKVKHLSEQEAVIVGYTAPRGSRKKIGALVLAARDDTGKLAYVGHSGGGFTDREIDDLFDRLQRLKTDDPPVAERIPVNAPVVWVKPRLVCQIKFSAWTPDRRMRHPVYAGLRLDKDPEEVFIEKPVPVVRTTNESKVFWPDEGYTKGDVIDYYDRMAETILPHLAGRPQNLHRHPDGIAKDGFYQKDIDFAVPDFVQTAEIWSESNGRPLRYILCQNKETLLYLANLGCIEINPWNSRIGNLDRPDYLLFDLDPGTNSFADVVETAQAVRDILSTAGVGSLAKTSGKTGLHIIVPAKGQYDYAQGRAFAELVMRLVHRRLPAITSLERSPAKRIDKVYLDYLQNRRGQTMAAPYSLRPVPGAPVSTPLLWEEVNSELTPRKFTIRTIWDRLKEKGDLWRPSLLEETDLLTAVSRLEDLQK